MACTSQRTASRLLGSLTTRSSGANGSVVSSFSRLHDHQQHRHIHHPSSASAPQPQPSHADPHANVAQNQSPSPIGKHAEAVSMKWEDYFRLRKSRKTWGTVAAVPTSLAGVMFGGGYFANLERETDTLLLGFDPLLIYGVAMVGCVAGGWLSGPILGNALWRLSHRSVLSKMEAMDSVFLRHIQRKRVDGSTQSVNNPVPDYYGERIYSKKDYRRWLRDQAAHRRKASQSAGCACPAPRERKLSTAFGENPDALQ